MDVIGDTQYNVSRNLKMLYKAGLLTHQKHGKWVYYALTKQTTPHCQALIDSIRFLPEDEFSEVTQRCFIRLSIVSKVSVLLEQVVMNGCQQRSNLVRSKQHFRNSDLET